MVRNAVHPRVQWVELQLGWGGVVHCRCQVCGQSAVADSKPQVEQFAGLHANHQSSPTHYGAGDLVARATKAFGAKPCTPCEQRRRKLNALLPRVLRR